MNTSDNLFGLNTRTKSMKLPTAPEKLFLPATRDQLHHQLMHKMRLNRYDMRFMGNIDQKYLQQGKPLSQGQNELYEKIIHKYRKQLKKLGVQYKDVLALQWEKGIVSLDTLNQKTFFKLEKQLDDSLQMRLYFNFNKAQIEEVRALVHDDKGAHLNRGIGEPGSQTNFGNGQKYNFTWNNKQKVWYGDWNVYLFKGLYDFAVKRHVTLDESVTTVVNRMADHGTKEEWTPSVRIVHGRLYVSHIAETMLSYLENIDPTDLSIINVERYTKLGLTAPAEMESVSEYVNSISPAIKHTIKDAEDLATLEHYITESGRKVLFYAPHTVSNRFGAPKVKKKSEANELGADDIANLSGNITRFQDKWSSGVGDPVDINVTQIQELMKEGYTTLLTTVPYASLFRTQDKIGLFALEADKVIYITVG